eukprot:GFUD01019746.1.p1 GENE.GFUD01019746.1~~GFUD01019746.1.p1  ORF type:complete len:313 (-),score=77.41 GFUD01019746.1:325-1263(-)
MAEHDQVTSQVASRVTRSTQGKAPLSQKGSDILENEVNLVEDHKKGVNPAPTPTPQSPLTPHKISRVEESSLSNALQKLKLLSLTPKKTAKDTKIKNKQAGPPPSTTQQQESETNIQEAQAVAEATNAAPVASSRLKFTNFFPTRRSDRKSKADLLKEQTDSMEAALTAQDDTKLGIEVATMDNKGRGIKAVKDYSKGEFVVEYAGDIVDVKTAEDLEAKYSMDTSKGCYMYYFKYKGKQYCVDATSESGRFGRLLNHSRIHPNCRTKVVMLDDIPRLILVAKQDILAGTELLFDYGDRSKESLKAHPWLSL